MKHCALQVQHHHRPAHQQKIRQITVILLHAKRVQGQITTLLQRRQLLELQGSALRCG